MGVFASEAEVKAAALSPQVTALSDTVLEDMYIIPAERQLEETFNLQFASDGIVPSVWEQYFDNAVDGAEKKTEYLRDMKLATIWLVNRMVINPHDFKAQSMGSASSTFGIRMPAQVKSLLRRWSGHRVLFR